MRFVLYIHGVYELFMGQNRFQLWNSHGFVMLKLHKRRMHHFKIGYEPYNGIESSSVILSQTKYYWRLQ